MFRLAYGVGVVDNPAILGDWTPDRLFAGGSDGAYYSPGVLTSLWQDTAGTVAVTADGQSVLRIDDLSGNGNHMIQTARTAPLYKTSGGYSWLQTVANGANGEPVLAGGSMTQGLPFTATIGFESPNGVGGTEIHLFGSAKSATSTTDYLALARRNDVQRASITVRSTTLSVALDIAYGASSTIPVDTPVVYQGEFISAFGEGLVDGATVVGPDANAWTDEVQDGVVAILDPQADDRFYAMFAINKILTAQETADLQAWIEALMP